MALPVLLLFGPTASGKTEILESLFAGSGAFCPAEVISADSMQVYRGMDIGTAKPGAALRAKLPHHLIDIRDPDRQFSAGDFVRLAGQAVRDIAARGKLPVVSGGTGFYVRNFVLGLSPAPPSDSGIRRELREELVERGAAALFAELAVRDPVSAARIHPHDEYRMLRALEVWRVSGRPLSAFPFPGADAGSGSAPPDCRFLLVGLRRPREELYRRINARCAAMFRQGLPAELRRLFDAGYGPDAPGMRAIGYREFFVKREDGTAALAENLGALEELVARNSRRYAKRQMVYFASLPGVHWIDAGPRAGEELAALLRDFLEEK